MKALFFAYMLPKHFPHTKARVCRECQHPRCLGLKGTREALQANTAFHLGGYRAQGRSTGSVKELAGVQCDSEVMWQALSSIWQFDLGEKGEATLGSGDGKRRVWEVGVCHWL